MLDRMSSFVVASAVVFAAPVAGAATIDALVLQGDQYLDASVLFVGNAVINNSGQWVASTDFNGRNDWAILGNLSSGTGVIVANTSATNGGVGSGSLDLNNNGDLLHSLTPTPSGTPGTIRLNGIAVLADGDASVVRPSETAPRTWQSLRFATFSNINDSGQFLVNGSVSQIPREQSSLFSANQSGGFDEQVLAVRGDAFNGAAVAQSVTLTRSTGRDGQALNNAGQVLQAWGTLNESGSGPATLAVVTLDGAVIAERGQAAPIAGTTWAMSLNNLAVDLNNNGDWAIAGQTSVINGFDPLERGTNDVIVVNNEVRYQTGSLFTAENGAFIDSDPSLFDTNLVPGTATLTEIHQVKLADNGDIFFQGVLDSEELPGPIDSGGFEAIFHNDMVLVQAGVTEIEGSILADLFTASNNADNSFDVSDNGEWLTFSGRLTDGRAGLFSINIPAPMSSALIVPAIALVARRRR